MTPNAPTILNTRTTHKTKKRAWAKEKKPVAPIDVDAEFFQTMKAVSHAIKDKDGPSQTKSSESEDFDEDKHFCLSLVGQLKYLEPRYKSMVKFQIFKIFNDVEWMKFSNSQPQIHQQHHTQFMAPMFNSEGSKEFQPYEQQSFMTALTAFNEKKISSMYQSQSQPNYHRLGRGYLPEKVFSVTEL